MKRFAYSCLLFFGLLLPAYATPPSGEVVDDRIESRSLIGNKVEAPTMRRIKIYLPPAYTKSRKRFPVVYYLGNFFEGAETPFAAKGAKQLFDEAIESGVIRDFIFVVADFRTPAGSSWYVNSSATGNWEDLMIAELVPHIDRNYRTMAGRDFRAVVGDRAGGYGALWFGMRHPDIFGSVYALHPVGTGSGQYFSFSNAGLDFFSQVKSFQDLENQDGRKIWATILQAFAPDPAKPPLFTDPPVTRRNGAFIVDPVKMEAYQTRFFLERSIPQYAANLNTLRGLKMDWGRGDLNQGHIHSNQFFVRKLDEYGVRYEAEEYRGGWGDRTWGKTGRIYTDVLPFLRSAMAFDDPG